MTMRRLFLVAVITLAAVAAGAARKPAESGSAVAVKPANSKPVKLTAEGMKRWGGSPTVFIGKLVSAQAGPVGMSYPPMRTHKLLFEVACVLRGDAQAGTQLTASHVVRGDAPSFPVGKKCIASVSLSRRQLRLDAVVAATPALLAEARAACSVPLGWSMTKGKLVSPWAALGAKAWPAKAKGKGPLTCTKTGRAALLAGPKVKFTVEPAPPAEKIKWTNPDGDGEYIITVENVAAKPIEVPAVLTDGKKILWDESLVILCQGKTYTAPLSVGVAKPAQPVKLKSGQKVSGRINALMLTGPKWPQGGYRIEFTFCLGEKSSVQSFYYMSRHHDKLRQQAQAERKAKLGAARKPAP